LWIFGALIILAIGITLQVAVTTHSGNRRTTHPGLGAPPVGFMPLFHER
jgi:hypothetical protein